MPSVGVDMEVEIQKNPAGWWLPREDNYFSQFMTPGKTAKANGFMRDHLLEAFKYVKQWDVAVDVGAHVGFWTYDLAKRFNRVYAYEPNPASYQCLLMNTKEFDNVVAENLAVGDTAGACKVCPDQQRIGNTGSYFIQPDPWGDIAVVRLNERRLPGCDLLKIDVEGFEYRVLEGAGKLIRAHKPVIIMECTDRKFRGRYADIEEGAAQRWLLKRGYREVADMRPDKVFVPTEQVM